MSELDIFEARVRDNIKMLASPDAKTRRQAAVWLGEAGDPSAITRLRQIYEEDPDSKVRAAAAYSLGMFRALEEGLAGPQQEAIVEQLEDIALKGKFGRRSSLPRGLLAKLVLGLFVSLIILLAFNFVIWPQIRDEVGGSGPAAATSAEPTSPPPVTDLDGYLALVRDDVEALRAQYVRVIGGDTVDCAVSFNRPAPFAASSAAENTAIADDVNRIRAEFDSALAAYESACRVENPVTLTAADVAAPLATLVAASASLSADLAALNGEAPIVEPPPAEEPTPEPAGADLRPVVVALLGIMDEMEAPRGPTALLNTYWVDIRDTGSTAGCSSPVPTIPADYILSSELAGQNETLKLVVDVVNTGLGLTRQGWEQFTAACASGRPLDSVEVGLSGARSAIGSFTLAREQLAALLG